MSAMSFSNRVRNHPRIVAHQPSPGDPLSLAVKDQLLVCQSAWSTVQQILPDSIVLTTVLHGLSPAPGSEDVNVVKTAVHAGDDIFRIIDRLRDDLGANDAHKVSPNHVLIPAVESHGCPWGAPTPINHPMPKLNRSAAPFVPVTIIDSGYQWDRRWGTNPLDEFEVITESEAQYVSGKAWVDGVRDVPDATGDCVLDALAGHANFIAGVIAQGCEHAQITIRNHNGGFHPESDDFPTEAAVARSLCESGHAKVINLGFAFVCYGNTISCVWDLAFNQIGSDPIVVAPAGNQNSTKERYPAALHAKYPTQMIGVASIDGLNDDGSPKRSSFSNHGGWVTCAAHGAHVHSTFLSVDMPVEDDTATVRKSRDFTKSAWATWNGTSFATPRVVAELATDLSSGGSPVDAVKNLTSKPPATGLGAVLATM